jgi:hypothetical protein
MGKKDVIEYAIILLFAKTMSENNCRGNTSVCPLQLTKMKLCQR